MAYGKKFYKKKPFYKKKRFYRKKAVYTKTIPRTIPGVMKLKNKYNSFFTSSQLQNAASLGTPFTITIIPMHSQPFILNTILPTTMLTDKPNGINQMIQMGYENRYVYAAKVKFMVVVSGIYSFTSPNEWILAPHIYGDDFPSAALVTDNVDQKRQLTENGIQIASVQGQVSGKTPNNVFTYNRYFTRTQILKHKPTDTSVDVSLDAFMPGEDEVYWSCRFRAQNELTQAAVTNAQATDMHFKVYLKITQYSRWERTGLSIIAT